MEAYINVDLSKNSSPTSYAFKYNQSPSPSIKFLLHNKDYLFDMTYFDELRLSVNMRLTQESRNFTLNSSNVISENGIDYVLWNIPAILTENVDTMNISMNVAIIGSGVINISPFQIVFYDKNTVKLELTLNAIRDYNEAYAKYLTGIKSFEFESPDGVPRLDEDGIVKWKQIPYYRHKHQEMRDTLYDVNQIHGMRINRETLEWMYYDNDDNFWYFVNQVYGGGFDRSNKPTSYDIYGGDFMDFGLDNSVYAGTFLNPSTDNIVAGTFSNLSTDTIYAGNFRNVLEGYVVSGGEFGDSTEDIIDALYFDSYIDDVLDGGVYGDDVVYDIFGGIF